MSKVEVLYIKDGRRQTMARKFADVLVKLGHVTLAAPALPPALPPPLPPLLDDDELLASASVATFAAENGVKLEEVVGTGKDGRIKKSDVEAVIAARV